MKWLETKIPPPFVFLVSALMMWLLNHFCPAGVLVAGAWNFYGFFSAAAALVFIVSANLNFRRVKTTVNPRKPQLASRLVTNGIFGFCRNPMYLGLLLLLAGWGIYLGSSSLWVVPPIFFIYISVFQILPEERVLTKKFGSSYQKYMKKVGRWSPWF